MRGALVLLSLLALAACGADGEPEPVGARPGGGVTVSGTASVGVRSGF